MKQRMNLFDILAIGEATGLNKLIKRVNSDALESFFRENRSKFPEGVFVAICFAIDNKTPYLYAVNSPNQQRIDIFLNYEEALRFTIKNYINQLDFYK